VKYVLEANPTNLKEMRKNDIKEMIERGAK
jgi:hypothetical protein